MSLEQAYLVHAQQGDAVPVPITVVAPPVDPDDVGRSVPVDRWIEATGAVANAAIVSGCPDRSFRRAVLAVVRQWKFRPAQAKGRAIARRASIPVSVAARPNLARFVPDFCSRSRWRTEPPAGAAPGGWLSGNKPANRPD